ncbi:Vasopressin V1b receptor [Microtus ochrogaster]|uniref:Vasopressin V1b receptor n=1 Tax=Microtus ochrogaster TaxID=79684 RepID=A0A8J6GCH8_MICOH|nr:Vasopressin V1b receptor [Microtus ochrogaster]
MDSESSWTATPSPGGTLSVPNATIPWLGRDEELAKVEIGILATVLVLATGGNLAVLLMLGCQGRKRSRMHLFVLHLALTDLGVAIFQVLPQLLWDITYRFQGSDLLCRAVKYLQVLSMFASTYMLLAMTLDRYLAVCHPLRSLQQPSHSTYPFIAGPWLLAAILSLPQIFIFSLREVIQGSGVLDCWADFYFSWGPRAYITWTTMAIFVLPVAMLTACYSLICCEIYKNLKVKTQAGREEKKGWRTRDRSSSSSPAVATRRLPSRVSSISTISRAKIRTVKMTFVIVLAYIACWAPFFSVQMWSVWDEDAPNEGKYAAYSTNVAFTISMLLGNLSSCCNPWIYMGFNSHLLPRSLSHRVCCRGSQPRVHRQLSNSSLASRRTTLLTHSGGPSTLRLSLNLSLHAKPRPAESPKGLEQRDGEAIVETSIF